MEDAALQGTVELWEVVKAGKAQVLAAVKLVESEAPLLPKEVRLLEEEIVFGQVLA